MAKRRATKTYETLSDFAQDYEAQISKMAIQMPAGSYRGELANNVKIDLRIPDYGRVGPVEAQVIFRSPDGLVAFQILSLPDEAHQAYKQAESAALEVLKPFLDQGTVLTKEDHEARIEQVRKELLAQFEEEKAALEAHFNAELERIQEEAEAKLQILAAEYEQIAEQVPQVVQEEEQHIEEDLLFDEEPEALIERGYKLPNLSDLEPSASGGTEELAQFLFNCAVQSKTGVASVQIKDVIRYAYFEQGNLIAWRTDVEQEQLGHLLKRSGQLTDEQHVACERLMKQGVRLGEAAQNLGYLTSSQVLLLLEKQTEFITSSLLQKLKKTKLQFEFYEQSSLPEKFEIKGTDLYVVSIQMMDAEVLRLGNKEVFARFASSLNSFVQLEALGKAILGRLGLSAHELLLFRGIQKDPKRLKDLFTSPGLDRTQVGQRLFSFWMLDLISFSQNVEQKTEVGAIGGLLEEWQNLVEQRSHFEVLSLHWICTSSDVEQAYQQARNKIERMKEQASDTELLAIKSLEASVESSYKTLRSDEQRRNYRKQIFTGEELREAALTLEKRGQKAVSKLDKSRALSAYSKAIELMPENPDLRRALIALARM